MIENLSGGLVELDIFKGEGVRIFSLLLSGNKTME